MTEQKLILTLIIPKLTSSANTQKNALSGLFCRFRSTAAAFSAGIFDNVEVDVNELCSNEDPFVDELFMDASNLGIPDGRFKHRSCLYRR